MAPGGGVVHLQDEQEEDSALMGQIQGEEMGDRGEDVLTSPSGDKQIINEYMNGNIGAKATAQQEAVGLLAEEDTMRDVELQEDAEVRWRNRSDPSWRSGTNIPSILWTAPGYFHTALCNAGSSGFWTVARSTFNYPDPDRELYTTAWLDGLRGLAAFEVFIFHYCDGWLDRSLAWGIGPYMNSAWYYAPFVRTFFASGDAAVCLFFAISGYVLSYRMLHLIRKRQPELLLPALSSAVFRRAIRLYTPVFLETLMLMLMCRWFGLPKPVKYEPAPTFLLELQHWWASFVLLVPPLRFPDRWDTIVDVYDGGISWTIPLEYYGSIQIYLAILFLCRVRSITVRRSLIFLWVLTAFVRDDWIPAQFLLGMSFADYQIEREGRHETGDVDAPPSRLLVFLRRLKPAFLTVLFIFGFYLSGLPGGRMKNEYDNDTRIHSRPYFDWITQPMADQGLYHNRQPDRYILCIATMCSMFAFGEGRLLRSMLETRPVQYLGRISFGLYLCHIFVRAWIEPIKIGSLVLLGVDVESTMGFKGVVAYVLTMIPAIMINFFVAGMFERFLDRPSVKAGKEFEKWCLGWGDRSSDRSIQLDVRPPAS